MSVVEKPVRSIVLLLWAILGIIVMLFLVGVGVIFLTSFGGFLIPLLMVALIMILVYATKTPLSAGSALGLIIVAFIFGWFTQWFLVQSAFLSTLASFFGIKLAITGTPSEPVVNQILNLTAIIIIAGMAVYYAYASKRMKAMTR